MKRNPEVILLWQWHIEIYTIKLTLFKNTNVLGWSFDK